MACPRNTARFPGGRPVLEHAGLRRCALRQDSPCPICRKEPPCAALAHRLPRLPVPEHRLRLFPRCRPARPVPRHKRCAASPELAARASESLGRISPLQGHGRMGPAHRPRTCCASMNSWTACVPTRRPPATPGPNGSRNTPPCAKSGSTRTCQPSCSAVRSIRSSADTRLLAPVGADRPRQDLSARRPVRFSALAALKQHMAIQPTRLRPAGPAWPARPFP